jgi:uncharacterized protein (TIGR02231 family)
MYYFYTGSGIVKPDSFRYALYKIFILKIISMKKVSPLISAIFLFSAFSVFAADNIKSLNSTITHVTVFSSGAQVTGVSEVSLVPGISTVAIQGLSPYIDEASLQVKGKGKFIVLSASLEKNYISELKEKEQIEVLRSKIKTLSEKIEDETLQTGLLKEEESFLLANKVAGGKNESLDAANFKILFDFYKSSLTLIRTDILSRERKVKDMNDELDKLNNQLSTLQSSENMPSGQVIVTLKADAVASGILEINYLVQGAGWYPSYDIRVDKLTEPVSLVYKANVFQNTGVDWNSVKLSFSNATPNQSGNVPWLNPWYLDFVVYNTYGYDEKSKKSAPAMMEELVSMDVSEVASGAAPVPVGFTTSDNTTSIEFNVDIPYTIETGGKSRSIDMMYLDLPASFEYQAVPKLDPTAFLVAQIREWQKYDLLEGEANLYFENTFVGKSMLNLKSISDTLNMSLGRDLGIIVKREKRKDFTSEKFVGSNKLVSRSWEISVRNNKKESIKIQLTDQIPLSQNKDIVVEGTEFSGGKYDGNTGLVTWEIDLPAGQSKSLILGYSVKYPKNSNVNVE